MRVFQLCNTKSLARCAACCRAFQLMVSIELRRRYFTVLRWFFQHRAREFHSLLEVHRGIISGSSALAFLAWTDSWDPGDMDVYVPENTYSQFVDALELSHLACLDEAFSSRRHPAYYGIESVRRYVTPEGRHLDVIQSTTASAASPLLYFWTSVVVNILCPQGVVCAFPTHTLNDRALVADIEPTDKLTLARGKYEARGYEFTRVDSWGPSVDLDADGNRIFSDDAIMVLDFHTVWSTDHSRLPVTHSKGLWVLRSDV
ncbi:hypothetical protein GSI_11995 [Ganoderma sinense ZZ0214-1]|uniref:F-box domain-containing protein n=1 Tax=Ganoderma sinense ZZ0214-1 TaxID=1077348 RepID=A0A2G8RXJ3_9APHY|nr:hypothetical protein GSI_11995 [Ganoderma sinense ZZ0214-1]